ncbi:MAG TPA: hypothetical protein PKC21_01230 [Oligoflexia bacterium]|nr:hypothetical protein [Oligoflexia bacterium]HMR23952.1 hypothetical protein [Oligoflexia bacterium]
MIALRLVLFLSVLCCNPLQAKTYILQYGNSKTCIVHLNQAIDSVEYNESDNNKVDIDTKKYKTLKINFKNIHQTTKMVIVAGYRRHSILYKYNKMIKKPCSLIIKQQKKTRIHLNQLNTEISSTEAINQDLLVKLIQLKYINHHLILELNIKNKKRSMIQSLDFEIATFKRKGILSLKPTYIKYFRDFKSNCKNLEAKNSKVCHVIIKDFYKKGYGLQLKIYPESKKNNPLQLYHKFSD